MAQIDLKNATIRIKDGSSHSVEVIIGEGNLTYTEKKNIEYKLDRGNLDEVREGDQVPVDLKFDFKWEYLKGPSSASTGSTAVPTIEDALKKRGAAAGWTSSDTDSCRPYAVDVEVEYDPPCTGDREVILFSDYRYEQLDHDLRAGTVSSSGRCNITEPTVTRSAQTT